MKRTTTRRRRQARAFITDNRRLFPFAGLFFIGVLCGVLAYLTAGNTDWTPLLHMTPIAIGWQGIAGALWDALFSTIFLLAGLFLLGLWPCGAPFILMTPLFYGLGLGLTEAYYFSLGGRGVLATLAVVMPRGLLTAAVLTMAGVESLRLSAKLARQLLPDASGGGLWAAFRLYQLRFLLFLLAAVAVGISEILLRMLCAGWLP